MRTYHAIDVAKRFLELAQAENINVTHMKLQKLVFFGQLVALKCYNGIPLHDNETLAWDYGPVVRELYDLIHRFGSNSIRLVDDSGNNVFTDAQTIEDEDAIFVIRSTWDKFKNWTAYQLSMLTHRPNSPWAVCYNEARSSVIPNELIIKNGFGNSWDEWKF